MKKDKFRVWDKRKNQFLYRPFVEPNGYVYYTDSSDFGDITTFGFTHFQDEMTFQLGTPFSDKKGKQVFEGDFVEINGKIHSICFGEHMATADDPFCGAECYGFFAQDEKENTDAYLGGGQIIGNIFENPPEKLKKSLFNDQGFPINNC